MQGEAHVDAESRRKSRGFASGKEDHLKTSSQAPGTIQREGF